MDQGESSKHLLLDTNHKDTIGRPGFDLQVHDDAAQKASTLRSLKGPHKFHSGLRLLQQLVRLAHCVQSVVQDCARFCFRFWDYKWTAETCSYVFALLTFGGLVTMLLAHQNQPIPEWPQITSINSIVSLFSLFMRTGVGLVLAEGISQSKWQWYRKPRNMSDIEYFDLASRSPWGSVLMLCNLKPNPAYCISALGALATIMTSLTGFFSQQLVQFGTCSQRDDNTAVTAAKTNNYTAHGSFISNYTADEYGPMMVAINLGLIQPVDDHSSVLINGCTSGNCTFPSNGEASISTVGISHVCKDLSADIRQGNGNTTLAGSNNSSFLTITDTTKTVLVTAVTDPTYDNLSGIEDILMLFRQRHDSVDFAAIKCSVFPTVNTYGVNITNSIMNERLVESLPILRHDLRLEPFFAQNRNDKPAFAHKMATTHTYRNGSRELCVGSKDPAPGLVKAFLQKDDNGLGQNATIPDVALYYPRDCVWNFGMGASSGIRRSLHTIFHGQELIWGGRMNSSGSVHLRALFQPPKVSKHDPDGHLRGKISYETVDNIMGSMARAMTAVVRTNGYEHFQGLDWYAYGDVWYTTTCVHVHWGWIMFPVIMLGLTGAFLLLVVIENRGVESDKLWKSSVLAALFCKVDVGRHTPIGKEEMMVVANSTSVSLEGNSGGVLRLTAH